MDIKQIDSRWPEVRSRMRSVSMYQRVHCALDSFLSLPSKLDRGQCCSRSKSGYRSAWSSRYRIASASHLRMGCHPSPNILYRGGGCHPVMNFDQ